ncbi:MAG: hypothetical protein AB8D52_02970 [Gammaproteobacteria bacterium]
MTTEKSQKLKSRLTLILLFVIFLTPFIGSQILYKYTDLGRDGGAASKGDLILPPITLENVTLLDPYKPEEEIKLHKRWSLLTFTTRDCDEKCINNVYRMRQIRLAIGKHYDRVKRVLVVKEITDVVKMKESLKDYQGQLIIKADNVSSEFIDAFKIDEAEDPYNSGRLYIIDPLGNLMMSYSADQNPGDIIKDLTKIFRVSRI